ncbi:putative glycosyl hydrolase [Lachnellula occidentalis]|uniref:Putative glycosyl hydrolase n=1 Tax=Lachnellula occidentalis TaxID=215460 RepID=A0A8H8UI88_9HELO|nr:putative glycosyl hydrolase [Lachnellula occidentalis]
MKKFLNKAKDSYKEFQDNQHQSGGGGGFGGAPSQQPISQQPNQPVDLGPPAPNDVLRYRYHHGTNLGSIFVLEKWLHGSMFPASSKGGSELDAATASLSELGLDATRSKFEAHWANAVSDSDFSWLVNEARCTSIRLPIGYFTLGPDYCKGTPFEKVSGVYVNAWAAVRTLVARARAHGIGVLIDLHALPGGANTDAHSGCATGKAEFWGSRSNVSLVKKVLSTIAGEVRSGGMDGVVGIQVVNEAVWEAKHMYDFYEQAVQTIGSVDASIPVYISDAWNLNKALEWCNGRRGGGNPVVVDTHNDKDRSQAPQEIIGRIGSQLSELDGKVGSLCDRGEAQELRPRRQNLEPRPTPRKRQPSNAIRTGPKPEMAATSRGLLFLDLQNGLDGRRRMGLRRANQKGNIPAPSYLCLPAHEVRNRLQAANERRGELGEGAKRGHAGYWDSASPGKHFEHWRYGEGWELGYSDAMKFFGFRVDAGGEGGDRIGCLEIWVKRRLGGVGHMGGFGWEWEQGFRAGVRAFEEVVGI